MSTRAKRRARVPRQLSQGVVHEQPQSTCPTAARPRLWWIVPAILFVATVAVAGAWQVSNAAPSAPLASIGTAPDALPVCLAAKEGDVNAKWRRAVGKRNEDGKVVLTLQDEAGQLFTLAAPVGTGVRSKEDGKRGELVLSRLASLPEQIDMDHFPFPRANIETVRKGQQVVTRNPETGKTELKTVARTFRHTATELVEVELADPNTGKVVDTLRATPEHPFFTPDGIVAMSKLGTGTQVVTRGGVPLVVKSIKLEPHPEGVPVYNLEVEDDHTYFVGQANGGTWVHNACFGNPAKLADHFARHGADFAAADAAAYEGQAAKFLTGARDPATLSKIRPNGDTVLFNPNTDEFGVISRSNSIRTYYKPNPAVHNSPTNLDYFNAQ